MTIKNSLYFNLSTVIIIIITNKKNMHTLKERDKKHTHTQT